MLTRTSTRRRHSFRLSVQPLEERTVLSGSSLIVNTTVDDVVPNNGQFSLREAIEQANTQPGADQIRFARHVQGEIELQHGEMLITDDLVINGPGAQELSVSGENASRVFLVLPAGLAADPFVTPSPAQLETAPEVTIRKLAIENGLATDAPGNAKPGLFAFGGGIYNLGGTLHLDRVEMTGNHIEGGVSAGGAVANEFGGTLTVSRSHFAENTSAGTLIGVGGALPLTWGRQSSHSQ